MQQVVGEASLGIIKACVGKSNSILSAAARSTGVPPGPGGNTLLLTWRRPHVLRLAIGLGLHGLQLVTSGRTWRNTISSGGFPPAPGGNWAPLGVEGRHRAD